STAISPRVISHFKYELATSVDLSSASAAVLICNEGLLALVDAQTGKTIRKLKPNDGCRYARLTPDGSRVIAGGYGDDGTWMRIWDASSGVVVASAKTKGILRQVSVS